VKSVALWSANIRKLAKDHKGCGSAANYIGDIKNGHGNLNFLNGFTLILQISGGQNNIQ
jgi:hypothetical protein